MESVTNFYFILPNYIAEPKIVNTYSQINFWSTGSKARFAFVKIYKTFFLNVSA